MPETKNNRRVRFTRSALREALIDQYSCCRCAENACLLLRQRPGDASNPISFVHPSKYDVS